MSFVYHGGGANFIEFSPIDLGIERNKYGVGGRRITVGYSPYYTVSHRKVSEWAHRLVGGYFYIYS